MLKTTRYGEVTRFDLARTLAGKVRYWTTAYLVGKTLIDTGCAFSARELVSALREVPLKRVINTHTHEDHIGANGLLQAERPGLEFLAHSLALPVLADPRGLQPLHPYRRVFWGWPHPCQARPLEDGDEIRDGEFCFQVVHTPGHSRDHISLFEPGRAWLFSGDLFVGGRDRALRAGADIHQIMASLKLGAALLPGDSTLFPGSARVRTNPRADLAEKIAYYEELYPQVIALHQRGESIGRIARRLFGPPLWIEWVTLGHFSRRCLVKSYLKINEE
jgi:glyoxylase-like metal-dependent hydrolase (beta-lactamase superfamily II)